MKSKIEAKSTHQMGSLFPHWFYWTALRRARERRSEECWQGLVFWFRFSCRVEKRPGQSPPTGAMTWTFLDNVLAFLPCERGHGFFRLIQGESEIQEIGFRMLREADGKD